MDRPAIHACEAFAHAGYPLDAEAMLIIEVEGSTEEQDRLLSQLKDICNDFDPISLKVSQSPEESLAIWKGRKGAFGAIGRISPDYLCMDGTIPTSQLPHVLRRIQEMSDSYGLKVANIFHAGDGNLHPLIMFDANDPSSFQQGGTFRCRYPDALRRGRRLPDRRAWCRHRKARPDAGAVSAARTRPAAPAEIGVRSRLAAEPQQGLPADRGGMIPATEQDVAAAVADAVAAQGTAAGPGQRHQSRYAARRCRRRVRCPPPACPASASTRRRN